MNESIEELKKLLHKSLVRLREQREINQRFKEPVAVIGMSGVFPGATDLDSFWSLLHEGRSGISHVPSLRWDVDAYYDANREAPGKMVTRRGGFIEGIELFDAGFFNVSPREALYLDPQQRLLLMQSWHALENAGIKPDSLKGSATGVFVGIATQDYLDLVKHSVGMDRLNAYTGTGNALSTATGRLSYSLGLEGPNMALDTACSSSLVALHEACRSLQHGECNLALVGGVNAMLSPDLSVVFSKAGMLSPDGLCKTFDEKADGYVRGEGCGVMVVKRLSDAQRDGDRILAVIKASGINQDGASSGLTVPNGDAQERLLREVLNASGVSVDAVDYLECHGTGTSLGDPIEVHAIGRVYGSRSADYPLKLGSVKTNIGHLEAAAGMAGLMKTILAFEHHELPAHLNFQQLNHHINLNFPAEIVTANQPWTRSGKSRLAGVSSFGFSGTNAHVILEEAPVMPVAEPEAGDWVLCLSAKTEYALSQMIQDYIHHLESYPDERIQDIVYTANTGRAKLEFKAHFKATTRETLLDNLKNNTTTDEHECTPTKGNKISLPTYPFERQRYWLDDVTSKHPVDESTLSSWCYDQRWQLIKTDMALSELVGAGRSGSKGQQTLVIACTQELFNTWQERSAEDDTVHVILHDKAKKQIKAIKTHLEKLAISRMILLCQADENQSIPEQSSYWMRWLLNITQTLAAQEVKPEFLIITEGAQLVDDHLSAPLSLALAPIIGFVKCLQLEIPELNPRLIDVDDLLDTRVWSNLERIAPAETLLAIRKGQYYGLRVEKQSIPESEPFKANPDGTYLITGGLGALGQAVAGWLIEHGAKHLVLTSRRAASEAVQGQLDAWLQSKVDVDVLLGDVGSETDVVRILNTITASAHPLCGVLHLAGVAHDSYITEIALDEVDALMRAKVDGAYYLHEHTHTIPLDCFVLFSSISAFIGSQKQSIYAASNAFLNQLSLYRQQQQLPGLSIDWGPWAEKGMMSEAFNAEQLDTLQLKTSDFIQPSQGMALLSKLIAQPNERTMAFVSANYLRFMLSFMPQPVPAWVKALKSQLPQPKLIDTADTSALVNRLLPLTKDAQQDALRALVCSIVAKILGVDDLASLNTAKGFFELGMNSLMAIELQQQLQRQLGSGIELKASVGFDYPTIDALTQYLHESLLGSGSSVSEQLGLISPHESIAIIGMSCRFPGHANNPELFWDLLANGRDGITEVPMSRWDMNDYYDADRDVPGKSYVKRAGFIDDIEQFDAAFFNISPREAETMDPQQRLLLEESYTALARAGYSLSDVYGSQGGVFVGVSANEYGISLSQYGSLEDLSAYYATGSALNVIAGRLSYTFGLEGPSEIVDTACSSSLVALHNAIQSLRQGECRFAIVGGVNTMVRPETFIMLSKANMLSPDGYCKTFDAKADGYVRGEGCGVLILKRLSDALSDHDSILAVIRGSAVNQDGASSGLTVPRGPAQQAVIEKALSDAQVSAAEIDYVEAHGTGTSLGDPIEVDALAKTYGLAHNDSPFILGAVKTNIGHLESASGMAGVMKVILSLQNQQIPAHLNFNELNPHIDLSTTRAQLPLSLMPWVKEGRSRFAGVSSFGFSGTNAHIILEEALLMPMAKPEAGDWVLFLSAKTASALSQMIQDYIHHLQTHPDERIQDIVYTTNTGRAKLEFKAYFKATTREVLLDNLNNNTTTDEPECTPTKGNKLILPTHPFERKRYWLETNRPGPQGLVDDHPFLMRHMNFSEDHKDVFETDISKRWPEFMPDHYIYGKPVVAGATYVSALVSVIERLYGTRSAKLTHIEIIQPVVLDSQSDDQRTIRISVDDKDEHHVFKITSFADRRDTYLSHVEGEYVLDEINLPAMTASLDMIRARCVDVYTKAQHVERTSALSYDLGPHFSWIEQINYNEHELLALMRLPDKVESKHYLLYPGFIDSCFQTLFAWMGVDTTVLSIPIAIQSFSYDLGGASRPEYVYIRLPESSLSIHEELPALDIYILDKQGQTLGFIEGFKTRAVSQATLMTILSQQQRGKQVSDEYVEHWEKRPVFETEVAAPAGSVLLISNKKLEFATALATQLSAQQVPCTRANRLTKAASTSVETIIFVLTPLNDALDIPSAYREQLHALFDFTQSLIKLQASVIVSPDESQPRALASGIPLPNGRGSDSPPQVWIVTQGAQQVVPHDEIDLSMSGIMGFYKTFIQEHPEFQARLIDIEPCQTLDDAKHASHQFYLIWAEQNAHERIWACREDDYYVQRLVRWPELRRIEQHRDIPENTPYRMTFERGSIASIEFSSYALADELGPMDAEIQIQASAISFRDVLNVQGLYPGDAGEPGGDCTGIVTRLGADVKHLRVGDRVFGMSSGSFASHAQGLADWFTLCPASLSAIDICTLPTVFLTNYLGLITLAKLTSKDTVLIHAASGGIGLIAIQIAQHIGARIIATAGSARKRAYLHGLGIQHVFDSRRFDYVEQIKAVTQGAGVDVVLNFLVGDFIEQTLKITKAKGRFIEIGKRDIYSQEQMQQVRPDIDYHIFALDDLMQRDPPLIKKTLAILTKGLEQGIYHPLPVTGFSFTHIISAFNYMARVKQIGKIVLTPPEAIWPKLMPEQDILIIGGLGGIGYALAGWCIAHGALRLVLTGRQPKDEIIEGRLDALVPQNATVQIRYDVLDIMNQDDCIDLMKRYPQAQIIFNTAGIVDDATLNNLTWDAVNRVLSPKVDGSWHLQQALQSCGMGDIPLISFSSMASILGSGGQAHYAAANGFLNALTTWRAQHHEPGVTVAWGPWADVGMAKNLSSRHAQSGVRALKPDVGFEALWQLLGTKDAPSTMMVADIAWDKLSGAAQLAFLDNLAPKSQLDSGELLVYLEKLAPSMRLEALQDKIRELVAEIMGMSAASVPDDKGFFELGMDSLMAVELKNRLQRQIGADKALHSTIIFDYPNLLALAKYLAESYLQNMILAGSSGITLDNDRERIKGMQEADILKMAQDFLNPKTEDKNGK